MLNSIFASAAAGIEIKLAVNGSNNFTSTFCVDSLVKIQLLPRTRTDFCVQPRWSHDDFLHSASQRLHLVSKAIVAFDGNGTNIAQLPYLLCSFVYCICSIYTRFCFGYWIILSYFLPLLFAGDMIEVNEIQNKSVVFVSSTEKFIPPKSAMSSSFKYLFHTHDEMSLHLSPCSHLFKRQQLQRDQWVSISSVVNSALVVLEMCIWAPTRSPTKSWP